jgi:hypothetical protein
MTIIRAIIASIAFVVMLSSCSGAFIKNKDLEYSLTIFDCGDTILHDEIKGEIEFKYGVISYTKNGQKIKIDGDYVYILKRK